MTQTTGPSRTRKYAFAAATIAAALGLSAPAADAADNYILCGGSPGGLWSLLGAGLDAVVKAEDPNAAVTYQTSSGGFANIVQIKSGKCDLAIAHVGEAVMAAKGVEPFPAPVDGFAAVAVLYDWAPMQWIADKAWAEENGIVSLADLAAKKPEMDLVVNRRGILPSILAERSLELSGTSFEDIESWGGSVQFAGSKSAAQIMTDRKADVWVNAMFIGGSRIRGITDVRETTLLSVPAEVTAQMAEEFGSMPWTVKADAYDWLDGDVETFGARAVLLISSDADPAKVEALTAMILKHTDKVQNVHKAMAPFGGALMSSLQDVPYHPGAAAAYKAAGL
ncbi:TAXI family TRAP transporter solute-binding subunit [Paralimibaculum aggregatum]|uniref:TAXI family TRAP transporter solute-binding subunit n=1 Tax=Paralimibaculum aggregatum TaxID=3036245 RepID=A0ABQ6LPA3_9RHOB|nr:TAXI family TRAP transporter solute-binding subunit [Limibaculum sp. NKW23]GMG84125.1 TAXI family TRAP transporter solute-binding subunit [Limibaculum sp. NKW23]